MELVYNFYLAMKVLSSKQIKEADMFTIQEEPISAIDLMERASLACFKWISEHINQTITFHVFCGAGNNGGDGLCIARLLHQHNYTVVVYTTTELTEKTSDCYATNYTRLKTLKNITIKPINSSADIPIIASSDCIIDALFGIGLNKNITDIQALLVESINHTQATIIAIDIPSGLLADESSVQVSSIIVKATYTLSFEQYKLAFLMAENGDYLGQVVILSIGLHPDYLKNCNSPYEIVEAYQIKGLIKPRNSFSHKGNNGHVLIMAGSYGKVGAAVIASKASLRSGAGLVSIYAPKCAYNILQTTIPEAMVITDKNEKYISTIPDLNPYTSIGIGPGIGTGEKTANALHEIIMTCKKPMVIDADAINILAKHKDWLENIIPGTIFTPHPKEFERLVGPSKNNFERLALQLYFCKRYGVYIILKGKFTCITTPEGMSYFNPTGNAGMAKGGSGDMLTGILAALLAQGYSAKDTCIIGTYLHGLAADIAVKKTGEHALLASDCINHIGKAFIKIVG